MDGCVGQMHFSGHFLTQVRINWMSGFRVIHSTFRVSEGAVTLWSNLQCRPKVLCTIFTSFVAAEKPLPPQTMLVFQREQCQELSEVGVRVSAA